MLTARGVGMIARIGSNFWPPEDLPKTVPDIIVAEAERDWIIGGLERLIDRDHAIPAARAAWYLARAKIRNDAAGEKARHGVDQGDIDDAAVPRPQARDQSGHGGEGRVLPRENVCG